jgi:hypothetical protein
LETEEAMTIRVTGALAASLLLVLVQASACARVKSETPRAETAPPPEERQTPAVPPPVEQSEPKPVEPPKTTERPPTATAPPKPAEPPQSKAAQPSQPKPPAPAPSKPSEAPRPSQSAEPPSKLERAAIVDLTSLETRLRDTNAIGVFTKLALKNEVDDLLERFRTFHAGRGVMTLAKLHENFDLLVLKVVSLLQDKDPPLAREISVSREALWNLLADPVKFKTLG